MKGKKAAASGKKFIAEHVEQKKSSLQEQISDLEEQIAKTKYNKATQRAVGLMKAKLAVMKERSVSRAGAGKAKGDDRFSVRKTGDGTVLLLGFPSVGKSTLLNSLTGAKSAVAAYAFTTLAAVPGLLKYNHAKIQIIDVPGIVEGAAAGTGRGGEVLSLLRSADLVLILVDSLQPQQYGPLLREVHAANIRLNQRKPDVVVTKKTRGGLTVSSLIRLNKIDVETVKAICTEFRIINADVLFREDIDTDQFIDVIEGNRVYVKALTVITKSDMVDDAKMKELKEQIQPDLVISATLDQGISELKEAIYEKLDLIRIYLKEVNKKPDLEEPLIMFRDCMIKDVCSKLHKDFVQKFKFARIWGTSAKFDGQTFHKQEKILHDGDIIELHVR